MQTHNLESTGNAVHKVEGTWINDSNAAKQVSEDLADTILPGGQGRDHITLNNIDKLKLDCNFTHVDGSFDLVGMPESSSQHVKSFTYHIHHLTSQAGVWNGSTKDTPLAPNQLGPMISKTIDQYSTVIK